MKRSRRWFRFISLRTLYHTRRHNNKLTIRVFILLLLSCWQGDLFLSDSTLLPFRRGLFWAGSLGHWPLGAREAGSSHLRSTNQTVFQHHSSIENLISEAKWKPLFARSTAYNKRGASVQKFEKWKIAAGTIGHSSRRSSARSPVQDSKIPSYSKQSCWRLCHLAHSCVLTSWWSRWLGPFNFTGTMPHYFIGTGSLQLVNSMNPIYITIALTWELMNYNSHNSTLVFKILVVSIVENSASMYCICNLSTINQTSSHSIPVNLDHLAHKSSCPSCWPPSLDSDRRIFAGDLCVLA